MMSFVVALLAYSATSGTPSVPAQSLEPAATHAVPAESTVTQAARQWLALVDAGKWKESWEATGQSFRSLNTVDRWQSASLEARVPLGQMLSRKLIGEQSIPAPPSGYQMVRFKSDFANKAGATETLSLALEGGTWRVVGIYIE